MDVMTSLMYRNSTLLGAIILVGTLAYIGTNVISPGNIALRRFVGYLSGGLLVVIGCYGLYFGASKELILLFAHVYQFDVFRLEWIFVGLVSIVVGFMLVGQSFRRM